MRIVVQRVKSAGVVIDGKPYSRIERGLLVLAGIKEEDDFSTLQKAAKKLVDLRIFSDQNDKLNLSVKDIDGEILAVSNFTVYGDCSHGNRPSFIQAMKPEPARELFEKFVELLNQELPEKIKCGIFQADMQVELINDGPVTVVLEI